MAWAGYYGGTWKLLTGLSTLAGLGLLIMQGLRGEYLTGALWGLVSAVSLFLASYHATRPAVALHDGVLKLQQGMFRAYVEVPVSDIAHVELDAKVLVIRTGTQEFRFSANWLDAETREQAVQMIRKARLEA